MKNDIECFTDAYENTALLQRNFYMKIIISHQAKEGSYNIIVSTSIVMPFIFARKKDGVISTIRFLEVAMEHDFSKFIKNGDVLVGLHKHLSQEPTPCSSLTLVISVPVFLDSIL